ncbi:MAG: CDP-alcohol phosphatidyltransferase family protein, partial [Bacteroidota bacterium]
ITAFSALRLAKFNLDKRQSEGFIGLPTPANTIWIASLPLMSVYLPGEFDFLLKNAMVLMALTFASCWLLIAELPMLSFKMTSFSPAKYPEQFLLVAISAVLVWLFSVAAPPLIIVFYVLLSVLSGFRKKTA